MFRKNYTKKKVYTRRGALKALKRLKEGRLDFIEISGRRLRENRDFYMEALDYTSTVLENAEYVIINDYNIIKKAIECWNGEKVFKYASEELKRNNELVRQALTSSYYVIFDLHDECYECLYDKKFVKEIMTKISDDYNFILKDYKWLINQNRENLLCAAISLWRKLPNEIKDDGEIYDICKTFINFELLV